MGIIWCCCWKQDDAVNQVRHAFAIAPNHKSIEPLGTLKNTSTMSAGRRSSSSCENTPRPRRRRSNDSDQSQALLDALQAALGPRGRPRERRMSSISTTCYQSRPTIMAAGAAVGAWQIDRSPRSDDSRRARLAYWTRSPESLRSDDGSGRRLSEPPHTESRKSIAVSDDMVFVMDI